VSAPRGTRRPVVLRRVRCAGSALPAGSVRQAGRTCGRDVRGLSAGADPVAGCTANKPIARCQALIIYYRPTMATPTGSPNFTLPCTNTP
jgi:hypothetical protein